MASVPVCLSAFDFDPLGGLSPGSVFDLLGGFGCCCQTVALDCPCVGSDSR